MTFQLDVITPEKVVFTGEVNEVVVPTKEGQIGILPNHTSLLAQLSHGELIIKIGTHDEYFAIEGGFVDVEHNRVSIIADYAVRSQDIEIAQAEAAIERAKQKVEERTSQKDFVDAQAQLRRALMELKIAEQRKARSHTPNTR